MIHFYVLLLGFTAPVLGVKGSPPNGIVPPLQDDETWDVYVSQKWKETLGENSADQTFHSVKHFFRWLVIMLMPKEEFEEKGAAYIHKMSHRDLLHYIKTHKTSPTHKKQEVILNIPPSLDGAFRYCTKYFFENILTINNLVKMKGLSINMGLLKDEEVKNLSLLKDLEYLDLRVNHIRDVHTIATLENLKALAISFPTSGHRNLKPLSRMSQLRELYIINSNLYPKELDHIGNLKDLTALIIENSHITCIEKLKGLKTLKELDLSRNDLDDKSVSVLSGFKNLRNLKLRYNKLGDEGIRKFPYLPNLKTLDVRDNYLTAAGRSSIKTLQDMYAKAGKKITILWN